MEVKRDSERYCIFCDMPASIVVKDRERLKLYWANDKHDGELTICKTCAKELVEKIIAAVKE